MSVLDILGLPASSRSGALSRESVIGYRLLERAHIALPKPAHAAMMEPGLALKVDHLNMSRSKDNLKQSPRFSTGMEFG